MWTKKCRKHFIMFPKQCYDYQLCASGAECFTRITDYRQNVALFNVNSFLLLFFWFTNASVPKFLFVFKI